ncbi:MULTISPECIES: ribulose-bisphosphate carboxylase large subunit family protein [unclassified Bradyrhizobium]|uniref:ribulose-bisphosphate carboxylase large subunit family protein n=1 Tax=unclassified Bradyrhizobium TaxID=2631580 RepID=UPI001FF1533D|nr:MULTISPECIES: ribulose-bisphosphate carboxylase large subunit family protein [unclassified Bradyrhizobium]MCJ9699577.1 ribulose-bisphosphate carboxylase large subunit family protein [Bradyrhizobium sp. SHOUNA76]MCJ9728712.1 ribulose-bisphosphate carboxylase large subunit family protein [Bradyrhizobium sp. PRIMUS42]
MTQERIEADYLLETPDDVERTAETIAGEQSSGTFVPVPGETPELRERAAAKVVKLDVVSEAVGRRSLPSSGPSPDNEGLTRAKLTLSWPLATLGPSLPNLMSTVAGNLFELRQVSGLRILDIRLPPSFAKAYCGPKFGAEGTRRLAGVKDRPLIGTIIKPSVGFSPGETAALVKTLCEAGIDFIKDDELQADGPYCPFNDRVAAVMREINSNADKTGKKAMYAFNLTGDVEEMKRRHDVLLKHGATCLMASLNSVGLAGMIELAKFSQLPIHAHRNGWGYLSRYPMLGWSFVAWHKIWRLAGADHMHVNGLANKFSEGDESVIEAARACLTPMFSDKPCTVMPVFSSGQGVKQVPGTHAALNSTDLIVTAGGGIMGHPGGPGAGVSALREAWDAALQGVPQADYALTHPALQAAMDSAV